MKVFKNFTFATISIVLFVILLAYIQNETQIFTKSSSADIEDISTSPESSEQPEDKGWWYNPFAISIEGLLVCFFIGYLIGNTAKNASNYMSERRNLSTKNNAYRLTYENSSEAEIEHLHWQEHRHEDIAIQDLKSKEKEKKLEMEQQKIQEMVKNEARKIGNVPPHKVQEIEQRIRGEMQQQKQQEIGQCPPNATV
jgi:flagellar biosynthesis/type III secretory pathway M-ring protein FliF/YscJ